MLPCSAGSRPAGPAVALSAPAVTCRMPCDMHHMGLVCGCLPCIAASSGLWAGSCVPVLTTVLPAQSCCQTCGQCAGPLLEAQPTFDLAALLATLVARMHAPAMQRTDAVCAAPCKPLVDTMQLLDEARSDPSAVSFAVRPVEVVMARSHSRDAASFSSLDGAAAPVAVGHCCRSAQASAGKPRHVADSSADASRVREKRNRQGADGINRGLPAARASLLHAAQSPTRRAPSANLDKMLPRPAFGSSPNLQVGHWSNGPWTMICAGA